MTVGERIKLKREELGLSQSELAKKMGYSGKASVSKAETWGDNITTTKVMKYAEALGCSFEYLMGWEEEEKQHLNKDYAILLAQLTKAYINGEYLKKLSELSEKDKTTIYGLIDVLWSATHSGEQQ